MNLTSLFRLYARDGGRALYMRRKQGKAANIAALFASQNGAIRPANRRLVGKADQIKGSIKKETGTA